MAKPDIRIAVVEDSQVAHQQVRALTSRLRHGRLTEVTSHHKFSNGTEFRAAMISAGSVLICSEEKRRLLIVSCHGEPETGTDLVIGVSGESISLDEYRDVIDFALVSNLTVLLSACFGGYADNVQQIASCSAAAPPFVIGPLVSVIAKHAKQLQNEIIDQLDAGASDDKLAETLDSLDRKYSVHYHTDHWIQYLKRSGEYIPPPESAGLATTVSERFKARVVEMYKDESTQLILAVLATETAEYELHADILEAKLSVPREKLLGLSVEMRCKVQTAPSVDQWSQTAAETGTVITPRPRRHRLVDIVKCKLVPLPPNLAHLPIRVRD